MRPPDQPSTPSRSSVMPCSWHRTSGRRAAEAECRRKSLRLREGDFLHGELEVEIQGPMLLNFFRPSHPTDRANLWLDFDTFSTFAQKCGQFGLKFSPQAFKSSPKTPNLCDHEETFDSIDPRRREIFPTPTTTCSTSSDASGRRRTSRTRTSPSCWTTRGSSRPRWVEKSQFWALLNQRPSPASWVHFKFINICDQLYSML